MIFLITTITIYHIFIIKGHNDNEQAVDSVICFFQTVNSRKNLFAKNSSLCLTLDIPHIKTIIQTHGSTEFHSQGIP